MGYIKLDRAIANWRFKTKPNYVALWVELLLRANHTAKKWNEIVVDRGQLVTSYESLQKGTGLSLQQIRTIFNKLKDEEITIKSTNKYSVITILNYDKYQGETTTTNKQTNNQDDENLTFNQQTTNKQLTTNKNNNNIRKKEYINNNNIICPELSVETSGPEEQPKYKMLLKHKNTFHPIYQKDIDHYQEYYPAVNVEQQIRNMVMWCESHPAERKTQTGIKAFITRWLNKEQNRVGNPVDELKRKTQEAYIKDVERKIKVEKKGDDIFL